MGQTQKAFSKRQQIKVLERRLNTLENLVVWAVPKVTAMERQLRDLKVSVAADVKEQDEKDQLTLPL